MNIRGVNSEIDSCAGMIAQSAHRTYRKIGIEHRRWIDPEDIVQDALLAAVESQRKYVDGGPAKYSTYLYKALFWMGEREYLTPLQQQKRAGKLVELDAPIADTEKTREVADYSLIPQYSEEIEAFNNLCEELSSAAILLLVRGLLCQDWSFLSIQKVNKPELLEEIRDNTVLLGIEWSELYSLATGDEKNRKMALQRVAQNSTINLGIEADVKLLECVQCAGRFSLESIRSGRFFVGPITCRTCFRELQNSPDSCFGKEKTNTQEGFSAEDAECRLHCIDRVVCAQIVKENKKETIMSDATAAAQTVAEDEVEQEATTEPEPEVEAAASTEASTTEEEEEESQPVTAAPKAKAKPAKVAVAKAPKEPKPPKAKPVDPELPKEVGPSWPWKANSIRRYCFQQCFQPNGISAKALEKKVLEAGYDADSWKHILKNLRDGRSGKGKTTHTWKLDEEGGRLHIHHVKYVGDKEGNGK